MTEYDKQNRECALLFSLFNATLDQQEMLKGQLKQNTKHIFNKWYNLGRTLMLEMEKVLEPEMIELIESNSERLHDTCQEIRNDLTDKILIEEK